MAVKVNDSFIKDYITEEQKKEYYKKAQTAFDTIKNKSGAGSGFLGWVDLPVNYDKEEYGRIKAAADKIRNNSQVLIVIGIGGSYLGARAGIEYIHSPYYNNLKKSAPDIYFVGNSISPDALNEVILLCEGKDISINVISKSGRTTEPAVAFRIFRELLEKKYNISGAKERIFVTTDKNPEKSNIKKLADLNGYETFVVPDDIGGRYSVLTAVGLLPLAVSGADLDAIFAGAAEIRSECLKFDESNNAAKYAVLRNALHSAGKSVEVMTCYEPAFTMMNEWWKQLFGESEGKDKKGIYPSSTIFSTDLHSLGQFIQDGSRIMFETVMNIKTPVKDIVIPEDKENIDGMDYINNAALSGINDKAFIGTVFAHTDGGTPNIVIDIEKRDEKSFGELVYFFEFACAISGYMLGVNPFDQPGVEAYKKNMYALIGNPAPEYIEVKKQIEKRLSEM